MPSLVVQRFAAAVFRQGGEHDFLITDEGASTLTLHSVFVAAYANDPTEQGKSFYRGATEILEAVESAEARIVNITENLKGSLYVAAPGLTHSFLL